MVLEVNEGWETSLEVENETLGENMLMMLITTIHQSTILKTTFSWLILVTKQWRRGLRGKQPSKGGGGVAIKIDEVKVVGQRTLQMWC